MNVTEAFRCCNVLMRIMLSEKDESLHCYFWGIIAITSTIVSGCLGNFLSHKSSSMVIRFTSTV